jgi:hypothetical protein
MEQVKVLEALERRGFEVESSFRASPTEFPEARSYVMSKQESRFDEKVVTVDPDGYVSGLEPKSFLLGYDCAKGDSI